MNKVNYKDYRKTIRSGDLLVWTKRSNTVISKMVVFIIRLFTMSEYSHVGVAWHIGERLYVLEAIHPKVAATLLSTYNEFYHVPMNLEWKSEYDLYLLDKVGSNYSVIDAIRGYFGLVNKKNNQWQCAELVTSFYKYAGLHIGNPYTPSDLVVNILIRIPNSVLKLVTNK
jgi:hypothetical protein